MASKATKRKATLWLSSSSKSDEPKLSTAPCTASHWGSIVFGPAESSRAGAATTMRSGHMHRSAIALPPQRSLFRRLPRGRLRNFNQLRRPRFSCSPPQTWINIETGPLSGGRSEARASFPFVILYYLNPSASQLLRNGSTITATFAQKFYSVGGPAFLHMFELSCGLLLDFWHIARNSKHFQAHVWRWSTLRLPALPRRETGFVCELNKRTEGDPSATILLPNSMGRARYEEQHANGGETVLLACSVH